MEFVVAHIASKSRDLVVEDYGNMNLLVRWIIEVIRPFKLMQNLALDRSAREDKRLICSTESISGVPRLTLTPDSSKDDTSSNC